jgi:ubiquinone/menaquinone biosynthesis C-methylase UbiE
MHGTKVVSMDRDITVLKRLREKSVESILIIQGDARNPPFRDSSFDCMTAIQMVENLPNNREFFKGCHGILKEEGHLLFNQSNKNSYKEFFHRILSSYRVFYRHSFYDVLPNLSEEDFKIERCIGYNWAPFKRISNNILINIFGFIESALQLNSIPSISPWVSYIAKERRTSNESNI